MTSLPNLSLLTPADLIWAVVEKTGQKDLRLVAEHVERCVVSGKIIARDVMGEPLEGKTVIRAVFHGLNKETKELELYSDGFVSIIDDHLLGVTDDHLLGVIDDHLLGVSASDRPGPGGSGECIEARFDSEQIRAFGAEFIASWEIATGAPQIVQSVYSDQPDQAGGASKQKGGRPPKLKYDLCLIVLKYRVAIGELYPEPRFLVKAAIEFLDGFAGSEASDDDAVAEKYIRRKIKGWIDGGEFFGIHNKINPGSRPE